VTYSIGHVQHHVTASMEQWWTAHQALMKAKEHRKLSVSDVNGGTPYGLHAAGAVVHVFSNPCNFTAVFRVRSAEALNTTKVGVTNQSEWGREGSAALHEDGELNDTETTLLGTYSTACTTHILSRICAAVEASFPGSSCSSFLSTHLASIAWYVVQHTVVALGASIDEHVAFFSVPCSALPTQCVVYPGLLCPQRLPSKRAMKPCERPRVLLLAGHLSYPVQPAEDLVDYVRSYSGYLDKLFQRLVVWNPDIIVVEGGMHHYLRERIEAEGHMRVLLHVGHDFLARLSWCLHADIIADLQFVSVSDLATTAPLGGCARFEVLELAEEHRCCAFSGFSDVCFHTLVFRGASLARRTSTGSRSSSSTVRSKNEDTCRMDREAAVAPHQWSALEQLGMESIIAAYHAAMQAHWLCTLLHFSGDNVSIIADVASAAATVETTAATSCLSLNCGCQFPPEMLSACQSAGAAASRVRDTLVLNVVFMDHLFESNSSGNNHTSSSGTTRSVRSVSPLPFSAENLATVSLTRARSSDLAVDTTSLPASRPPSAVTSRSDLVGLLSSGLDDGTHTPQAATRAESSYAVVQQSVVATFYGTGDGSLYTFLLSRCTSTESQLLYLHGGHRVRVRAARAAPKVAVTAGNSNNSNSSNASLTGGAGGSRIVPHAGLEAAQKAAFSLTAMRQTVARMAATGESSNAAAGNAFLHFLQGYFTLRISSEVSGTQAGETSASVPPPRIDVNVPICSPHLLNLSTAAFLEWVFYGWMAVICASSTLPQRLRLVFTFHPDAAVTAATCGGVGVRLSEMPAEYKDTVTLLIDSIPLLKIQYPLPVIPTPPALSASAAAGGVSATDVWYATHDAEELQQTVTGFHIALNAALNAGITPNGQTDVDDDAPSSDAATTSPSQPPSSPLSQLCERAQVAVEALRESQLRGTTEVALFLRPLRQHLIPTLMSDYRAWQAETRKILQGKLATTPPVTATGAPRDGPGAAAAAVVTMQSVERGVLRNLEDCYFHPDRPQWIRLGEPTSILAVSLELMYSGVMGASPLSPSSPVVTSDSGTFHRSASLASAPSTPRVTFALTAEAFPQPNLRSSSTVGFNVSGNSVASLNPPLLFTSSVTRAEALNALRQSGKADAGRPTSLACSLCGYKPVLPSSRVSSSSGTVSNTVNAIVEAGATGASAIIGFGGAGVAGGGPGGSSTGNNSNNAAGELKVTVEVLFPHAFAALHVLYTDNAPLDFAAALLRCRPFTTEGGKSQSRFFVTEDGRFLLKCVKSTELRYFKEWAPKYFARMAEYYSSSPSSSSSSSSSGFFPRESTLGKVLGLYVVHVQSSRGRFTAVSTAADAPATQTPQQQQQQQQTLRDYLPDGAHCFMVAEQLLFQRPVRETWDLKGSQRNRTTEQRAAVRLDVDLVQERLRNGDFFFCTPEAKRRLMEHLSHDTQLLADSGIMDYSLMASVGNGNLYVGMIDFLHPYSSAKVLESKMKSGLDTVFGYTRREPTIIDPPSYAARFMLWMDGYLNAVPDRLFALTCARLMAQGNDNTTAAAAALTAEVDSAADGDERAAVPQQGVNHDGRSA
jgi:hypothetical protein